MEASASPTFVEAEGADYDWVMMTGVKNVSGFSVLVFI